MGTVLERSAENKRKELRILVGEMIVCENPTRYFSPGDYQNFCKLTCDQNDMHWNPRAAMQLGFDRPIAPGMFVASLAVGVLTSFLPPHVRLRGIDRVVFREKMDQLSRFAIRYRVMAVKMKLAVIEFSVVGLPPPEKMFVQGRVKGILP